MVKSECASLTRERDSLYKLAEIVFRNPRQVYQTTTTESESRNQYEHALNGGWRQEQQKARDEVTRTVTTKHEAKDEG